ncbi:alpha/beta hydrolase, partial [Enterococcus faecalis]
SIQCKKVGKNYIRVAKARRKDYMRDQVDDKTILAILDTITGVFGRTPKTTKKQQNEIVKQLEQNEDVLKPTEEDTPSEKATEEVSETKPTKQKAKTTAPVNQTASKVEPAKKATVQRRIKPKI